MTKGWLGHSIGSEPLMRRVQKLFSFYSLSVAPQAIDTTITPF